MAPEGALGWGKGVEGAAGWDGEGVRKRQTEGAKCKSVDHRCFQFWIQNNGSLSSRGFKAVKLRMRLQGI